jgi:hypothetical protein
MLRPLVSEDSAKNLTRGAYHMYVPPPKGNDRTLGMKFLTISLLYRDDQKIYVVNCFSDIVLFNYASKLISVI